MRCSSSARERLRLARPEIVQQAAQAHVRPWWATLAAALTVYATMLMVVRPVLIPPIVQFIALAGGIPADSLSSVGKVVMLLAFSVVIALCMLYVHFVERRSIRTLGFVRRRALRTYGVGLLLGGVSFALVFGISWALGAIRSVVFNPEASAAVLALLLLGYAVQSMGEETLSRGFMLGSLGARYPMGVALVVSSVVFGLLHSLNSGVTALAVGNIVLVGFALGLMFVKTGDLWLCGGFHCMWNFMQGPMLGIAVSGGAPDASALLYSVLDDQSALVSGGAFGLEAGIATTCVAIALVAALAVMKPVDGGNGPKQPDRS